MGQQYPSPTVQKAKEWRGDLEILSVSVCAVQIFDIDRTSLYILVFPFAFWPPIALGNGPMS